MEHRFYDIERFNRDLPITDVMTALGLDVSLKRNIKCPSPEHKDARPSAKIYTDNNICYCFACNRKMGVVNVVKTTLGVNWKEACDWLIDRFPCQGFYNDYQKGSHDNTPKFPLSTADVRMLGLSSSSEGNYSLYNLFLEDRECFDAIVAGKAAEVLPQIADLLDLQTEILDYYTEKREELRRECRLNEADVSAFKAEYPKRSFTSDSAEYKFLYYDISKEYAATALKETIGRFERCRQICEEFPLEREQEEELEETR